MTAGLVERPVLGSVVLRDGRAERSSRLDSLRGLAILCMVADHLALFGHVYPVRLTVGRLAMPVFFILGGHLARRFSLRTFVVVPLVGVALEVVAPWAGSGGLLVTFACGAALVVLARRAADPARWLWLVVLVTLAAGANGWLHLELARWHDAYYSLPASLALMAAGALVPRSLIEALPSWRPLAFLGRHPLSFYAGHVLVLSVVYSHT